MSTQSDPLKVTAQELPLIIIAGDSWGCGEWESDSLIPTHRGLEDYLSADGYSVINVSQGSSSLDHALSQIHTASRCIDSVKMNDPVKVFLFQTECIRTINNMHYAYEQLHPEIKFKYFDAESIHWILSRYYYELSHVAQTCNLKIGLIGGHSDTLFLDKFELEYPGLFIACQSLVNLCINDSDRVEQPVFQLDWVPEIFESLKRSCTNDIALEYLLLQADLSEKRYATLRKYTEWFPDKIHAGRLGHKKLWLFLKNQKLV